MYLCTTVAPTNGKMAAAKPSAEEALLLRPPAPGPAAAFCDLLIFSAPARPPAAVTSGGEGCSQSAVALDALNVCVADVQVTVSPDESSVILLTLSLHHY